MLKNKYLVIAGLIASTLSLSACFDEPNFDELNIQEVINEFSNARLEKAVTKITKEGVSDAGVQEMAQLLADAAKSDQAEFAGKQVAYLLEEGYSYRDPEGDKSEVGIPARCRPRVPDAGSSITFPFRW